MKHRPEFVRCVKLSENKTWCGRIELGFTFQDPSHAILNAKNQGRLLICPGCAKAMIAQIQEHTY